MYKIFVSGMAYDSGKSGISDYIEHVVFELCQQHKVDLFLLQSDLPIFPVRHRNLRLIPVSDRLASPLKNMLWHLFVFPFGAPKRIDYDFLLLPAANRRLFFYYPRFTIACIHDLSQFHVENKYDSFRMLYIKKLVPLFLQKAHSIYSVSENTRKDLQTFYHIPPERVFVNHNGFDATLFHSRKSPSDAKKLPIGQKYILYISRIEHPGKNHLRLIQAYEQLPDEIKQQYHLVFGGKVWQGGEIVPEYAEKSKDRKNIHFLGFVADDLLPILYRNATVYAFSSLYEGFGIPLLEAMACGTPVVCSNASSLPEIGGDAVLTFEPYHIEDIRDKLLLVLQNQELRSEMIAKGFLQIEKFSWKKHAEKIIEEFEKNAKKSVHSRLTHLQEFEKKIYREEKPYLNQLEILKKFIKSFFLKGFHHFIEILISLFVSLFLLPIHLIYICLQMVMKRSIFKEHVFFGKDAKPLPLKLFHSKSTLFNRSALFWYVNIGKMNLIGPSLKPYSEQERETGDAYLFQLKPGIVDLWFIRQSSRTGFEGRFETEKEYFATSRPLKDFFLLFQSLPSLLFHQETEKSAEKLEIFDIPIMNITMEQSLEMIQQDLQQENFKRVYFLNPDCLNKSLSDKDYKEILLNQSDYLFADGIGIVIASKLLGNPLIGNVNGTDLFPFLCQVAEKEAYRLFFLGAKPGIPEQLTENLLKRYPNLIIAGSHHGYFNHQTESKSIIKQILTAKPDVLFVAFGAPAQEKWITEHINELKEHPIVVLGVGGLFDFYSETKKRAPRWMRQIGLEWVFRLLIEPKRMWKRYILGNPYFLYQVMIYKLSKRRK